jgi:hypothetical protein
MQNGRKTITSARQPRPASFAARSNRPEPKGSQNAQRNYERYLALARAQHDRGRDLLPVRGTLLQIDVLGRRSPLTKWRHRRQLGAVAPVPHVRDDLLKLAAIWTRLAEELWHEIEEHQGRLS